MADWMAGNPEKQSDRQSMKEFRCLAERLCDTDCAAYTCKLFMKRFISVQTIGLLLTCRTNTQAFMLCRVRFSPSNPALATASHQLKGQVPRPMTCHTLGCKSSRLSWKTCMLSGPSVSASWIYCLAACARLALSWMRMTMQPQLQRIQVCRITGDYHTGRHMLHAKCVSQFCFCSSTSYHHMLTATGLHLANIP